MNTNACNNLPEKPAEPIIIVGAGWSGLACAVTLAEQGYKVCLLESARHVGGKARSVNFKDQFSNQAVDNGQHIMLGAYYYTRTLFKSLGLKESDCFERQPLELQMFSPNDKNVHIKAPLLPAPLHLLTALLNTKGFTVTARFKAIQMALKLAFTGFKLNRDISVYDLLVQHKQTEKVIQVLWEPLCLATMNTPIQYASGKVFLSVLKDSFSRKREDSDLMFFRFDLSRLFCKPAVQFISAQGSQVICADKVVDLRLIKKPTNNSTARFIITTRQKTYHSHQLVLAAPANISNKLLHSPANMAAFRRQSFLKPENASLLYFYEPIYTIYLQYPPHIKLPGRMIGLFHSTGQWAIDRSLNNQPGLIAVVISGPGKHTQMPSPQLIDTIHNELSLLIEDLPAPLEHRLIKEKRATFSCRVGIEDQRPVNETAIPGLYLAGDYTNTGYPCTLEGAIKSGVTAAHKIINNNSRFTL